MRTAIRWLQVSAWGPGGEGEGGGAALSVVEVCPGSLQSALSGAAPRPARLDDKRRDVFSSLRPHLSHHNKDYRVSFVPRSVCRLIVVNLNITIRRKGVL